MTAPGAAPAAAAISATANTASSRPRSGRAPCASISRRSSTLDITDPTERIIGLQIIDMLDPAGYVGGDLAGLAERLGCPIALVEIHAGQAAAIRACAASSPATSPNASPCN